ncbi:caffeoylshikimate esterase-like [Typha angustifolia]|uniref:caffeoylshikimate esterase-like n=1 Tax=Typha angustifolia TaxID=59011 RepID=UPI003C30B98B
MEYIKYEEEFILNLRGNYIFTCRWFSETREPKALVFLCHGYAMECSISMRGTAMRLASAGYFVHGIDYEGHGKSSGLQGYIASFDELVNDCSDHFTSICEKQENKGRLRFLLGESMGGTISLLLDRQKPNYWNGAILVAPMCKIAEELKPHPVLIKILTKLSTILPTLKICRMQDLIESGIRNPEWRQKVRHNPFCYKGKTHLKTGTELLMASLDIEKNLDKVSLPFIIVHGGKDTITDPSVSKLLYETAVSKDKTFKFYPGMWHALTYGETPENIDLVFSDIFEWINERVASSRRRSERGHKFSNDPREIIAFHGKKASMQEISYRL